MKKNLFSFAAALMISGLAFGQNTETIFNTSGGSSNSQEYGTEGVFEGTLYSNGPYYNVEGEPKLSVVQTNLGLTTYGFNINDGASFRAADDWEITEPVSVEKIYMYAYQTGSDTTSTMTYVTFRIWDGLPESSNLIWGDEYDDFMSETEWTGVYRVLDTNTTDATRPIMVQTIETPGLTLDPGTYWLDFSVGGSLGSGPWASPITIDGETVTGNAIQFSGSTFEWVDMIDSGANAQQGLPFDVDGEVLLGVQDLSSTEYSIYPNPTTRFINVNAKAPIQKVEILNLTGQVLMSNIPNGKNTALDVSTLQKGVYILQTVINGKTQTTKFVKK